MATLTEKTKALEKLGEKFEELRGDYQKKSKVAKNQ